MLVSLVYSSLASQTRNIVFLRMIYCRSPKMLRPEMQVPLRNTQKDVKVDKLLYQ